MGQPVLLVDDLQIYTLSFPVKCSDNIVSLKLSEILQHIVRHLAEAAHDVPFCHFGAGVPHQDGNGIEVCPSEVEVGGEAAPGGVAGYVFPLFAFGEFACLIELYSLVDATGAADVAYVVVERRVGQLSPDNSHALVLLQYARHCWGQGYFRLYVCLDGHV